jgi:signal transduction histidine kinase
MLPMAGVMLATVVVGSSVDAWLAGRRAQSQIRSQLRDIGQTLAGASFPLTDNVLRQMRGLSGAEFVVVDQGGKVTASSQDPAALVVFPSPSSAPHDDPFALRNRISMKGELYLHAQLDLPRSALRRAAAVLHVLYPEAWYRRAWREAVLPPALAGFAAFVLVVVVSSVLAARVTRPLHRLSEQADRIACGEFVPLSMSARDDEIRDLAVAINRMAERLARYEEDVRRNEQLRTLGRLGGGIAHQLRNAVTGCRLALELHERECRLPDHESLEVACRQLDLTEEYVKRFLALGRVNARPFVSLNLAEVVEGALSLVRPKADHLGVDLRWSTPVEPLTVAGNGDELAQAVVNLLLNAMEAAAAESTVAQGSGGVSARVVVRVRRASGKACLEIEDTGRGPAEKVSDKLFEPLVSDKPDGVGLGLSIAREVVEHHGGRIHWSRGGNMTCFTVELPAA